LSKIAKITNNSTSQNKNISTNTSLTTMTKKSSKNIQTNTLDKMPMSPPIGGRKTPPEFKQYKGTKEEETQVSFSTRWEQPIQR
jgi:hypothetical protein